MRQSGSEQLVSFSFDRSRSSHAAARLPSHRGAIARHPRPHPRAEVDAVTRRESLTMTERPTILTEAQFAELIVWALCKTADGAGPGLCDPECCICGQDARAVAKDIYDQGYKLHTMTEQL